MKVKICGIMDSIIGEQVARLQPDYMGFVFANSRRQVTSQQASEIIEHISQTLTQKPEMVGVYSVVDLPAIEMVLSQVPLDIIQFHSASDLSMLSEIKDNYRVKIWLTIPIPDSLPDDEHERNGIVEAQLERLANVQPYIDAVLLDTHDPKYGGGSGRIFQWDVIPSYEKMLARMSLPLFVAGGLHVDNVVELKSSYTVAGVDVSSGVESNGIKDIDKVKSFIERVRMS